MARRKENLARARPGLSEKLQPPVTRAFIAPALRRGFSRTFQSCPVGRSFLPSRCIFVHVHLKVESRWLLPRIPLRCDSSYVLSGGRGRRGCMSAWSTCLLPSRLHVNWQEPRPSKSDSMGQNFQRIKSGGFRETVSRLKYPDVRDVHCGLLPCPCPVLPSCFCPRAIQYQTRLSRSPTMLHSFLGCPFSLFARLPMAEFIHKHKRMTLLVEESEDGILGSDTEAPLPRTVESCLALSSSSCCFLA